MIMTLGHLAIVIETNRIKEGLSIVPMYIPICIYFSQSWIISFEYIVFFNFKFRKHSGHSRT